MSRYLINRRDFVRIVAGAGVAAGALGFPTLVLGASRKVVVVGGGVGGCTAAKYLRKLDPRTEVTLVEAKPTYTSCFMSNEVLSGDRTLESLTFDYAGLEAHGVKVVTDSEGYALMFSRATMPHPRDYESVQEAMSHGVGWKRHLGLYAYRAGSLKRFSATEPTPLEMAERLEQLRYLETGGRIIMARACRPIPAGVDTSEDLERVRQIISD